MPALTSLEGGTVELLALIPWVVQTRVCEPGGRYDGASGTHSLGGPDTEVCELEGGTVKLPALIPWVV